MRGRRTRKDGGRWTRWWAGGVWDGSPSDLTQDGGGRRREGLVDDDERGVGKR